MRAARYVPTRWNLDRSFVALQYDTRLLLLGLWTWPETPTSGLTITAPGWIAKAIGIPPKRAEHCLVELANAGFVEVDPDSTVVWLRGFWEAQLGTAPNSNHRAATRSQIQALPDTPMLRRYRAFYGLDGDEGTGEGSPVGSGQGSPVGSGQGSPMGSGMALPSCPIPLPSHPPARKKGRGSSQSTGRQP